MGLEDGGGGLAELPLCGGGHVTCTEQEDTSSPLGWASNSFFSDKTEKKAGTVVVFSQ
jgi:hypothetical protein